MRYQTTTGKFVTAASRAEAAALAAQYGFGEIAASAPAPAKPKAAMSVALQMGRRFIGVELKNSYYQQAARNLHAALRTTADLFAEV